MFVINTVTTRAAARSRKLRLLLCAPSVFSVPLWLFLLSDSEPQRHREHRGGTEKIDPLTFRAKQVNAMNIPRARFSYSPFNPTERGENTLKSSRLATYSMTF